MNFTYEQVPAGLRDQLGGVVYALKENCPDLLAVYLHGSICLGGYVEGQSDVDILAVTRGGMTRASRAALADALLPLHEKPCPIELSVITSEQAKSVPVFFEFHFSSMHAARYAAHDETNPLLDCGFPDGDLPSYIKLISQCGITLYGEAPDKLLCDISNAQFFESITADIDEFEFDDYGIFDSNILTLARIASFAYTRRILTKVQGAAWAAEKYPQFSDLLNRASDAYQHHAHGVYAAGELEEYKRFMTDVIKNVSIQEA